MGSGGDKVGGGSYSGLLLHGVDYALLQGGGVGLEISGSHQKGLCASRSSFHLAKVWETLSK